MAESERLESNLCWEIAVVQQNKHDEKVCGDHVVVSRDGDRVRVVLSDGLGSGVQANIASTLTATILSGYLQRGLTLAEGIRAVEAALPTTKKHNLAYATFNIAETRGRRLHLVQFDSPKAVFLRDGVSLDYPAEPRTVGDKTVQVSDLTMKCGDMLILFSDGVSEAGRGITTYAGWERREMEGYLFRKTMPDDHARHVAASLVSTVETLDLFDYHDDTSVAVLRLRERQCVNLLLGPSDNWEPGDAVLRRFFAAEGKHAVCGNAAVQAAARFLGTAPRVLRQTVTELLPPVSYVEGLALACEAEQTLREALDGLELYCKDGLMSLSVARQQDGASGLINLLAEEASEATIFFHPETEGETGKERVEQVLRLRDVLTELGKKVTIEYC